MHSLRSHRAQPHTEHGTGRLSSCLRSPFSVFVEPVVAKSADAAQLRIPVPIPGAGREAHSLLNREKIAVEAGGDAEVFIAVASLAEPCAHPVEEGFELIIRQMLHSFEASVKADETPHVSPHLVFLERGVEPVRELRPQTAAELRVRCCVFFKQGRPDNSAK